MTNLPSHAELLELSKKITQGEWEYQENSDKYTHIVRSLSRRFVTQFPQGTDGEDEANARATVLVPKLLKRELEREELVKALGACLKRLYAIPTFPEDRAAIALAESALAHSKGE